MNPTDRSAIVRLPTSVRKALLPLLLAAVGSAALGALLSAAPPAGLVWAREAPRELVVVLDSAPATLDPFQATDAYGVRISHQLLHETLVRLDDDLRLVPGLARWERLSPTRYRFTLTHDSLFHNGSPVRAADAVATLRRFMDPATGSAYGGVLREKIARIHDPHGQSFEIELQAPFADFLADLILPVVPAGWQPAASGPARPMGSGPFYLERMGVGEIVLARNAPYEPGQLERVVFKVIKDESTRLLKFRKGDAHLGINVMPLDKLAMFERGPLAGNYTVQEAPGLSFQYLGLNLEDPLLSRPEVRRALAHAMDVDALIEHRQQGHATRATGLLPSASPSAAPGLVPPAHDPALARRLLDEAGLPEQDGKRFDLIYKTTNDRAAVIQARVIQADLRKVGIEVEVRSYEWATFYDDIKKGNFQLYSLRWIGVSDPGFLYELLHSQRLPPEGRNRGRYSDPAMDALLEQARLELDETRRRGLYQQVGVRVHAQLPFLSMWHNNNVAIVSRQLTGFRLHPSGGFEHLAELRWVTP